MHDLKEGEGEGEGEGEREREREKRKKYSVFDAIQQAESIRKEQGKISRTAKFEVCSIGI